MSSSSYFSSRFPAMRVVWEASIPIWMVFTGTSPESDRRTLSGLGCLCRRPSTRGRGVGPPGVHSIHGESMELLNHGDSCGSIPPHGEDTCGGGHLHD